MGHTPDGPDHTTICPYLGQVAKVHNIGTAWEVFTNVYGLVAPVPGFLNDNLDFHVVDVPVGGGVPAPLPLGTLARGTSARIELSSDGVDGASPFTNLLERGHVDGVFGQQRIGIFEIELVEFLAVSPLQELGGLRGIGPPSIGTIFPFPDHHILGGNPSAGTDARRGIHLNSLVRGYAFHEVYLDLTMGSGGSSTEGDPTFFDPEKEMNKFRFFWARSNMTKKSFIARDLKFGSGG